MNKTSIYLIALIFTLSNCSESAREKDLKGRISRLEKQLDKTQKKVSDLKTEIFKSQDTITYLRRQLNDLKYGPVDIVGEMESSLLKKQKERVLALFDDLNSKYPHLAIHSKATRIRYEIIKRTSETNSYKFLRDKEIAWEQYLDVQFTNNEKLAVVSDIYQSPTDNYFGYPIFSRLYNYPFGLEKFQELIPCTNYRWSGDDRFFAGFDGHQIFLYDSTGELVSRLKGYTYSFLKPNLHVFYRDLDTITGERNPQLIQFDYKNKEENVLYTFGKEYTFYDPIDHDGIGYPEPLTMHYAGIRGKIHRYVEEDSLLYNEEFSYTFIVSPENKTLTFWHKGVFPDKNKTLPKAGFIKNE